MVRVAVVGNDVSSLGIAAFLRHRRPDLFSTIHLFRPTHSMRPIPRFRSPWLRNDRKGRTVVFELLRDILHIGESEILVSDPGRSARFRLVSGTQNILFPSFQTVLSNLGAIAFEPFRSNSSSGTSLTEFLTNRFGKTFACKYAALISRCFLGHPAEVSAEALFPQLVARAAANRSVLLAWPEFGKSTNFAADFTSRLYQSVVTGGRQISLVGFDMDLVGRSLLEWLKVEGVKDVRAEVNSVVRLETGQLVVNGQVFDLVVTSEGPERVFQWAGNAETTPGWVSPLTHFTEISTTRICFSEPCTVVSVPIVYSTDAPIIGAVLQSALFSTAPAVVDVFHTNSNSDDALAFAKRVFPVLNSATVESVSRTSETVPSLPPDFPTALHAFHAFRKKTFGGRLVVLSQGALTDQLSEASDLANELVHRFEGFPKFVENEGGRRVRVGGRL